MGHVEFDNISKINGNEVVREMSKIPKPTNTMCKQCLQGKQTRTKFRKKEYSKEKLLDIIHTNICGPMKKIGLNGENYFMLLIGDYTRMIDVCFLKKNSKAFECFNIFK
jgi:hypothetical protein